MNHLRTFEGLEDFQSDSFIVQVRKNNRLFFITETCELTWRKENAWKFNTKEDFEEEVNTNRSLELMVWYGYELIKYSDARSH